MICSLKINTKKIFLSLLLVGAFMMEGQNYIISMYDTVKYGNCKNLLLPTVTFSNTSSSPVQMHFRRIAKNIPAGWTSCFCAPTCIAPWQDTLNFIIPNGGTKNNGTTQDVSPNFGTDTIPGTGEVIVVFNEIGVNHFDTIHFWGFTTCFVGINNFEKETFLIAPNPSPDFITLKNIDKQVKTIKLLDITGRETFSKNYLSFQSEFRINISDFPTGQYFLFVECSDGSTVRRKISKF